MKKGLRGHVTVELCNPRSGTPVKVVDDGYNVITNLYGEVINALTMTLMSPYTYGLDYRFLRLTPQNLSDGILLLNSPQNNVATTLFPKGKIVGYAGSEYNGDNLERGSINHSLTGEIPGVGYQWVYEWQTERANGLISSVGLTSKSVGDGNFITNDWGWGKNAGDITTGVFPYRIADDTPLYDCLDNEGNFYTYSGGGYLKWHKVPVGYVTEYRNGYNYTEYTLSSEWANCGRPQLYKDHIWLTAENTSTTPSKHYLLKIQKDTTNIVQQWHISNDLALIPGFNAMGLTDTHMLWVRPGTDTVKCFNLSTSTYETYEPKVNYANYGAVTANSKKSVVWFCSEDWACIMGSVSTSTTSSTSATYADIIYTSDFTVRNVNATVTGNLSHRSLLRMGNTPLGLTYADKGKLNYFGCLLPLFSIRNLQSPVEKDNTKTLKVTYKLLYS